MITHNRVKSIARFSLAIITWLLVWAMLSYSGIVSSALLPPPDIVIARMFNSNFIIVYVLSSLLRTFAWVWSSWVIGLIFSALLAWLALHIRFVPSALEVLFVSGRALPSVIAIPLFAAVMGSGRFTVAACTVFLVICYSELSFQESLQALSRTRRAMEETFKFSKYQELLLIILPGLAHAWKAIAVQSFGIALVVTVAGEMILSFQNTVGYDVAQKAWLLNMIDLYAIVGWLIILSLLIKRATDFLPELFEFPGRYVVNDRSNKFSIHHEQRVD